MKQEIFEALNDAYARGLQDGIRAVSKAIGSPEVREAILLDLEERGTPLKYTDPEAVRAILEILSGSLGAYVLPQVTGASGPPAEAPET